MWCTSRRGVEAEAADRLACALTGRAAGNTRSLFFCRLSAGYEVMLRVRDRQCPARSRSEMKTKKKKFNKRCRPQTLRQEITSIKWGGPTERENEALGDKEFTRGHGR